MDLATARAFGIREVVCAELADLDGRAHSGPCALFTIADGYLFRRRQTSRNLGHGVPSQPFRFYVLSGPTLPEVCADCSADIARASWISLFRETTASCSCGRSAFPYCRQAAVTVSDLDRSCDPVSPSSSLDNAGFSRWRHRALFRNSFASRSACIQPVCGADPQPLSVDQSVRHHCDSAPVAQRTRDLLDAIRAAFLWGGVARLLLAKASRALGMDRAHDRAGHCLCTHDGLLLGF